MKFRIGNVEMLIDDIGEILVLDNQQLISLAQSLDGDASNILSRADLRKHLEDQLPENLSTAVEVLESFLIKSAALYSHVESKDTKFSATDMKSVIEREFASDERHSGLVSRLSDAWPSLEAMIGSDVVRLVEKSNRLAFDHSDILTETHIVTDIRPVFDNDHESIERALIVQTINIEYFNNRQKRSISLAMDNADLIQLRKGIEKALVKATLAKQLIESKAEISVLVPGDSNVGEDE